MISSKLLRSARYLYTSTNYQKIVVNKEFGDPIAMFVKQEQTVKEFSQQLRSVFQLKENDKIVFRLNQDQDPKSLILNSIFRSFDELKIIKNEEKKNKVSQQDLQNSNLMETIFFNVNLQVFQTNETNQEQINLWVPEYNYTNNRNLPQIISRNIIQLHQSWQHASTIADCYTKAEKFPQEETQIILADRQIMRNVVVAELTKIQIYKKFISEEINLSVGFILNGTGLINVMMGGMILNWIFLFGVTYGKYGWDVGEPISYLTGLTVQLLAFAGIFGLDQSIENVEEKIKGILNVGSTVNPKDINRQRLDFHLRRLS